MKVHELLHRDPRTSALANEGQARLSGSSAEQATRELRAELETFVCEGQYADALERILKSYLAQLDRPRQNAAWVSGFFGSGKSHLLKMLGHLWVDTLFEDGATARSLVHGLPDDVVALLRELDTEATRTGRPALAAAGSLPSGSGDRVRLTVLSVLLRAAGLPEQYPQARFCLWLRERGFLEPVRSTVEAAGRDWAKELNDLYVSGTIASAVLACDPDFAQGERQARQVLRETFPSPQQDITTAQLLETGRAALGPEGDLPLTVLILDEVQQYIGDSSDRAVGITEVAEAIQTQLDSRVMLVASGQSALSGTQLLQKLRDRFRITVQLSDADVETVTRRVLLHKKPSAVEPVRSTLERNAGEVSKHLQGTRLAERASDRDVAAIDYPLLPTRRRFWEECFRAVDAAGTHGQLRSQLRILHDALRQVAERDLGAAIPCDALYDALAADLQNTGVLLGELATRIQEQAQVPDVGVLRRRLCGVTFLVSKLPREPGIDAGVRATSRTLADLLVEDLETDSGPFRRQVQAQLEAMVEDGTLMKVGEEYRLQTTQGAEWDRAFREQRGALGQRLPELQAKQDQLLAAAVQRTVADLRPKQGEAKVPRSLELHARPEPPEGGDAIVVWLRDGSSSSQVEVEAEARRRGHEDPVIHVFVPKPSGDLRARLVEAEAARRVLDAKGMPTEPPEAREACESLRSRLAAAEAARDELLSELVTCARVYQGGGNELHGESFRAKLEQGLEASLARLYPRFDEGDHRAWPAVLARAKQGSDEPLKVLGWDRPTEDHPVIREVLAAVGHGAKGSEVRKALKAPPFGWPQDALDAAMVTLHRLGVVRALQNGQPVAPGGLDQARLASAELRPERVRLGATDKLALRGLYQAAGVRVKSGEEELKASDFLETLLSLARAAGGDPPLPAPPSTSRLDELRRLSGAELLGTLLESKQGLEADLREWTSLKDRAEARRPAWQRLERLAAHAESLPVMDELRPELAALRDQRSLLDEVDPLPALSKRLEQALRESLHSLHARCTEAFSASFSELRRSEDWTRLPEDERSRITLARRLEPPPELEIGDAATLLAALDQRPLRGWVELEESLPTRFARARAEAARAVEPAVQSVALESPVLRTEAELDEWIGSTRAELARRLGEGPIVIG